MKRRQTAVLLAAIILAPVAGCSTTPLPPPDTATAGPYLLGSGDKLRIIVFGEDALTGPYQISDAGTVSVPLAGDIKAAGLTVTGLRDAITRALSTRYIKDPKVSVEITDYRPFYVLGEVQKPGQYAFIPGMTVAQAVATAGGFTYRARQSRIYVRHAGEPDEHLTPVAAAPVKPGDTLRAPERHF